MGGLIYWAKRWLGLIEPPPEPEPPKDYRPLIVAHLGEEWWERENHSHAVRILLDAMQETGDDLPQAIWNLHHTTLVAMGWPTNYREGLGPIQADRFKMTIRAALIEAGLPIPDFHWLNHTNGKPL